MNLTRSDISHLAELARLHVSNEDAERLSRELTQIIEFIDRASEEDLSAHPPMISPADEGSTVREDVPDRQDVGRSVRQAADTEDGYVRVPPVRGLRSSNDDGESNESPGGTSG